MSVMSTVCSQCGGTDIEYDQARGDAVCTSCGSVLEDNIIVSEVTFQEQSSGASTVVGQFVSAEGGKNPLSGTGFHHGMGKDSRELTLQQAKKRLSNLGNLLKLNQHCIDSAFMFFKMALNLNLTRGRKSSIVDTACLYLVCRSEGTPHLLLDFSDVLQINVYALGRAYLKLSNALHINPPAIDPCLYIHRFAHKLELGDKTHDVSVSAMRLVARMKRDWIHHGRRPAGLCGAALLVAARLHNFNRSVKEVAKVVKLSEGTIRKRLGDFKDTASSRLTIDEFLKIDLEQEHDPPSFNEAKKRSKQQQLYPGAGNLHLPEDAGSEGDASDADTQRNSNASEMEDAGGGFGGIVISSVEDTIARARITEAFMNASATAGLSDNLEQLAKLVDEDDEDEVCAEDDQSEEDQLSLEDIDDEEIEKMLLSEEEAKIKAQLWYSENADFLKEQELRKEKLAAQKAAKGERPKKRYKKRRLAHNQPASSAGEAIERMLVERRISTKINYDVLKDLDKGLGSLGSTDDPSSEPSIEPSHGPSSGAGSGLSVEEVTRQSIARYEEHLNISPGSALESFGPGPSGSADSDSMLTISRSPSAGRGRLPSLHSRKRPFSPFGSGSPASPSPKLSRLQDKTVSNQDLSSEPSSYQGPSLTSERDRTSKETPSEFSDSVSGSAIASGTTRADTEEIGEPETVEESGPVVYSEGEEEEEGLGDADMDELAYEGDPLLYSDYEEEGDDYD